MQLSCVGISNTIGISFSGVCIYIYIHISLCFWWDVRELKKKAKIEGCVYSAKDVLKPWATTTGFLWNSIKSRQLLFFRIAWCNLVKLGKHVILDHSEIYTHQKTFSDIPRSHSEIPLISQCYEHQEHIHTTSSHPKALDTEVAATPPWRCIQVLQTFSSQWLSHWKSPIFAAE